MATLGGGWIHPLVGAQYFAPASADGIPIVQKTRAVGSEGRAQNIAPLQLIRCLIVECGGMEPCVPTCEWLATTDPPRLTAPASLSPSCASGSAFRLHGEIHNTPSPMAGLLLASLSQMAALPLAAI